MPNASQHRNKADRNRRFVAALDCDAFPEWVVVGAFYTAVHLVEQLRAAANQGHSQAHDDRTSYVREHHREIHDAYQALRNVSNLARYWSSSDFFNQFQPADVRDILIDTHLAAIEAYVTAALTPPPPVTP